MDRLFKFSILGAMALAGVALPATAKAAVQATAIGSGWYLGWNLQGTGGYNIYEDLNGIEQSPDWDHISGLAASITVAVDDGAVDTQDGAAFTVTLDHKIYGWSSVFGAPKFTLFDNTKEWQSVAVGNESESGDIWATDTSGNIWMCTNAFNLNGAQSWLELPAPATGSGVATKVAAFVFHEYCATPPGNSFGFIDMPVIIDSDDNIFTWVPDGADISCQSGFWQSNSGSATDITDHFLLGTNNWVYSVTVDQGERLQYTKLYAPLSGGTKGIGNGPTGLWAVSNSGAVSELQ